MRHAAARLRRRDPLRRRLRAVDRRHRRRARGRPAGRLVLLRQRRSWPRTAPPAHELARATASGGTTTTGAPRSDVRAVVGSFPEPFLSGVDGKRLPVRLDCAPTPRSVVRRGRRAAERRRRRAPAARPPAASAARACCGQGRAAGPTVRRDSAVRQLEKGPRASRRVRARPTRRATRSRCSTPQGEVERTLGAGRRPGRGDARWAARRRPGSSPAPTTSASPRRPRSCDEERAAQPLRDRGRGRARPTPLPRAAAAGGGAVIYLRRASPLHATRAAVGVGLVRRARARRAVVRPPARARRAARRRRGGRRGRRGSAGAWCARCCSRCRSRS